MFVRTSPWLICTVVSSLCACSSLTEPGPGSVAITEQPTQAAKPSRAVPPEAPAAPPSDQTIKASHILIAYQGALRAAPSVKRSKDEAKAFAAKVVAEARAGGDFDALALKYSDDPSAKGNKGSLGQFTRTQMVKPFADAAFALKPQQIEPNPVETAFGFHIIKRTE